MNESARSTDEKWQAGNDKSQESPEREWSKSSPIAPGERHEEGNCNSNSKEFDRTCKSKGDAGPKQTTVRGKLTIAKGEGHAYEAKEGHIGFEQHCVVRVESSWVDGEQQTTGETGKETLVAE